jgi:translation initiation factor IF-2
MHDENKKVLTKAGPSKPVRIAGLDIIPESGMNLLAFKDEKQAKKIADIQKNKKNLETNLHSQSNEIRAKIISGEYKNINLIIKTDFHGSLEAVKNIISKIDVAGATTTIIRAAIGGITESEVKLAQSTKSFIIGFNIRPNKKIVDIAKQSNVEILTFDIIYKLKDEVENILKGSLDLIYIDKILGEAKILQI